MPQAVFFVLGVVAPAAAFSLLALQIAVGIFGVTASRRPILMWTVSAPPAPSAAVAAFDSAPAGLLQPGGRSVAVVVENQVDARPAFGLEQASVVYEVPAEGGITRFLAIFALDLAPAVVGPVRSVRPYLVDWAEEWGAPVFHSGGSPDGIRRVRSASVYDFDEISWNGKYFWRNGKRRRPHNLFTSGTLIQQAFDDYQLSSAADFTPWPGAGETPPEAETSDGISVIISANDPDYCAGYRYQRESNRYERWLAGTPQVSGDGSPLFASSVVVQEVSGRVLDREGRLRLATHDGGWATIFSNGRARVGRWEYREGKTWFTDSDGTPIGFPDGPIWVSVVLDRITVQTLAAGDASAMQCG